ncbi:hypothetical protein AK830_g2895 [Neonectria ditissima]|uniref:Uncharacterized protein n=1 Tax=Neonectria ditissima TaxID=78410 RepID=A0A0P7BA74_9HYPO|nr:hypothetical protein AK830_g2895 [Neonectria ditissima]
MCTSNIYTYVHPDGHQEQTYHPTLCAASVHGQPCANNVVFQHPHQFISYGDSTMPYMTQLPPTPQYSQPSTPNYRSADDSDHSYGSSSSKKKRASGVYVNGQKVLDLNRREGKHRERIVLVDNPPTPRTPPQTWTAPHTAPPSPNTSPYLESSPSRRRPVIVDERTVQIEVVDNKKHRSSHSRHASTSSRESRHSQSEEDEKRRRRHQREKEREEQEIRSQRLRARINEANAEIAARAAVPAAPILKRVSTYKRGAVEVPYEADLAEAVRRLSFEEARREEKAQRLALREERKEDEAQRKRLMERIQPRRRATVGPGSRRHRVLYDDGVYRWE